MTRRTEAHEVGSASVSRPPWAKREAQELETRLRIARASIRILAVHDLGLARMDLKLASREPLLHRAVMGMEVLGLADPRGKTRAALGIGGLDLTGTTRLELSDENGTRRATLATSMDGTPTLTFYDRDGREQTTPGGALGTRQAGSWVLWGFARVAGLPLEIRPVKAYQSQAQCESEAPGMEGQMQARTRSGESSVYVVCLPDTVDPRRPSVR
jgi:hypothetical protein